MSGEIVPAEFSAVKSDRPPDASERTRRQVQRRFLRNVGTAVLTGVLISWWLIEFTDFFPTIGGLLGLGGVFAWIAFLTNLVTKDRKDELQRDLEQRVLLHPHTATYTLFVLIAFALFAAAQGTVVIAGDGVRRTVEIRAGGEVIDGIEVPANTTVKRSMFVRPGKTLVAKTAGLPERRIALESFGRYRLSIPGSFIRQPVILATLPSTLTANAKGATVRVSVRKHGAAAWEHYGSILASYDGQSFWIGSSADVAVPSHVIAEWQNVNQNVKARWLKPRAVGADRPLVVNDVIRVCVMTSANPHKGAMASGEVIVESEKQQAFPQQLALEANVPAGRCP